MDSGPIYKAGRKREQGTPGEISLLCPVLPQVPGTASILISPFYLTMI